TKDNHKTASDALEGKLRSHANNKIKQNRIYGPAVYNIESIKKDIGLVKKPGFRALTTEEQAAKVNLLKQEALPDINDTVSINLNIESISKEAEELLLRLIEPTLPIQELLNETALQMWVKEGIPLHKDKRDTCAFCRQNLPHDIWQVLGSHFSKESSALESSIDSCLTSITTEIQAIPNFLTLTGDKFYAEEKILFENSKIELSEHLKDYMQDLKALQAALDKRKNAIFQQVLMPVYIHNPTAIQQCVGDINALIVKNNDRTISLENDKSTARESLRLTDVASFIADITYDNEFARIASLKSDANTANTAFTETEAEIFEQETEVTRLQGQQKDERKGAERVNELLSHFFGHDGIELEAKDNVENTSVKFEVTRDGKSAYNLSEGECSLIAKPIKNLDGTNSYRYKQLFISTHNLDFLKYLKKISLPNERNHGGCQHLIVERNGGASQISLMPSYLRDYITEFNYLFHQIYKCRNQVGANESHEPYYGFGNNLRKFLEAFLFFKFPHHDDKNDAFERIKKFFGEEDSTAIALVNRLNNEFSHLESIPDRGFKPVEIPEISKVANYVLDKIYASDPHQYNSLLKSIGEPPRLS
ncbi:TPA: AAA family ATPase, partial [Escherichia coli]|nr:AAA family ATPase [Escherichia coli]